MKNKTKKNNSKTKQIICDWIRFNVDFVFVKFFFLFLDLKDIYGLFAKNLTRFKSRGKYQ